MKILKIKFRRNLYERGVGQPNDKAVAGAILFNEECRV